MSNEEAKKKAKELVSSYLTYIDATDKFANNEDSWNFKIAKQCAIKCVEQMIWVAEWYERRLKTDSVVVFLNEVKSEIEKL